jgi:hypothetical protein
MIQRYGKVIGIKSAEQRDLFLLQAGDTPLG